MQLGLKQGQPETRQGQPETKEGQPGTKQGQTVTKMRQGHNWTNAGKRGKLCTMAIRNMKDYIWLRI